MNGFLAVTVWVSQSKQRMLSLLFRHIVANLLVWSQATSDPLSQMKDLLMLLLNLLLVMTR
jgi:hypothetical protein